MADPVESVDVSVATSVHVSARCVTVAAIQMSCSLDSESNLRKAENFVRKFLKLFRFIQSTQHCIRFTYFFLFSGLFRSMPICRACLAE